MKALETPEEKRARRLAKKVLCCMIINSITCINVALNASNFGDTL